jgi:hypothetical protein
MASNHMFFSSAMAKLELGLPHDEPFSLREHRSNWSSPSLVTVSFLAVI